MAMLKNQMVTFEAVGGDVFFVFLPSLPGLTHADPVFTGFSRGCYLSQLDW